MCLRNPSLSIEIRMRKRNSLMMHPNVAVGAGDVAVARNVPDVSVSSRCLTCTSVLHMKQTQIGLMLNLRHSNVPKRNQCRCPPKDTERNVHRSLILKSRLENSSTYERRIDTQIRVESYNGLQQNNSKERAASNPTVWLENPDTAA